MSLHSEGEDFYLIGYCCVPLPCTRAWYTGIVYEPKQPKHGDVSGVPFSPCLASPGKASPLQRLQEVRRAQGDPPTIRGSHRGGTVSSSPSAPWSSSSRDEWAFIRRKRNNLSPQSSALKLKGPMRKVGRDSGQDPVDQFQRQVGSRLGSWLCRS